MTTEQADPAAKTEADARMVSLFRAHKLPCPFCGYDLSRATVATCPECGAHVKESDYRLTKGLPKSYWLIACIVGGSSWIAVSPIAALWFMSAADFKLVVGFGTRLLFALLVCGCAIALTWWLSYRPLRAMSAPPFVKALLTIFAAAPGALVALSLVLIPVGLVVLYFMNV
jgi:hypothetical protein